MFTEWVPPVAFVPVTVMVKTVPAGAPAKMVMTDGIEVPTVVMTTGLGTNITVTPDSTALLVRATLPVKVLRLATVRTSEPDPPAGIAMDEAAAVRLKSGATVVTVRLAHVPVKALLLASPL